MALLSEIIKGTAEKYLASPTLTRSSEHFIYESEHKKITRIKGKKPDADNYREWLETKKLVSDLPSDYLNILKKKAQEGRVEKRLLGNGCEFSVMAKYNGFPVELYVVEHKTGLIKRAEYIAYNEQKNTVFIKSLLAGETYSDPIAQF